MTVEGEAKQENAVAVIGESDTHNGVGAIAFQNLIAVPYGARGGAGMRVVGGNTEALGASVDAVLQNLQAACRYTNSPEASAVQQWPVLRALQNRHT